MFSVFRRDDCAKEYKIGEELGRGSFATVKKGINRKDNTAWAIKCIDKSKLDKDDEDALETEVTILEKVSHPNIVRMKQVFDTPKVFYMVMELMTGGELFDRIVQKSKYGEAEASNLIKKLADALAFCHERGIVHRDLKPENLLYEDETEDAQIKIADFGLAKLMNQSQVMATACGTPGYVAPEILEGKKYTEKVDCWSLGVITYIILCGFPPFYDENNAALFAQIKSASYDFPSPYWDDISDGAKDLIRKLLVVDTSKRLSAADILKHAWVTGGGSGGATSLGSAFEHLRKYNARRRFRQGVQKVMAANTFARFGKLRFSSSSGTPAPAATSADASGATSSDVATGAGAGAGALVAEGSSSTTSAAVVETPKTTATAAATPAATGTTAASITTTTAAAAPATATPPPAATASSSSTTQAVVSSATAAIFAATTSTASTTTPTAVVATKSATTTSTAATATTTTAATVPTSTPPAPAATATASSSVTTKPTATSAAATVPSSSSPATTKTTTPTATATTKPAVAATAKTTTTTTTAPSSSSAATATKVVKK